MKLPAPVTCCSRCLTPGHRIQLANVKCGRIVGGQRCQGINQATTQETDWRECATCQGSGIAGSSATSGCDQCNGFGWLYQRRSRFALP